MHRVPRWAPVVHIRATLPNDPRTRPRTGHARELGGIFCRHNRGWSPEQPAAYSTEQKAKRALLRCLPSNTSAVQSTTPERVGRSRNRKGGQGHQSNWQGLGRVLRSTKHALFQVPPSFARPIPGKVWADPFALQAFYTETWPTPAQIFGRSLPNPNNGDVSNPTYTLSNPTPKLLETRDLHPKLVEPAILLAEPNPNMNEPSVSFVGITRNVGRTHSRSG